MDTDKTIYLGGNLVIGEKNKIIKNSLLITRKDKILYAGVFKKELVKEPAKHYYLKDCYIIPGIIDCHLHLCGLLNADPDSWVQEELLKRSMISVKQAEDLIEHGITSVCDVSKNGVFLKKMINSGLIKGPRISPCGPGLVRTGGFLDPAHIPEAMNRENHPWAVFADGEEEIRRGLRNSFRQGSDHIKTWATGLGLSYREGDRDQYYSQKELDLILEEARYLNSKVFVHCESLYGTRAAVEAGVDGIIHGEELDEDCMKGMVSKGISLVPTLNLTLEWYAKYGGTPPKRVRMDPGFCAGEIEREREIVKKNFQEALDLGVNVVMGSDTFCKEITPFGQFSLEEIKTMTECGLEPYEALEAATVKAAELIFPGRKIGLIKEDYIADFVILKRNPVDDIQVLEKENIVAVIKEGELQAGKIDLFLNNDKEIMQ